MLTRDIPLIPAIMDLADNCTDGARSLRKDKSYKGLWVKIALTRTGFEIRDNCGGISVNVARKYAFRFGRPDGTPTVKHSVGRFGVGMKRALFKLGRKFRIESKTKTSRFVLDVDVDAWAREPNWEFQFKELDEAASFSEAETGTTIKVSALRDDIVGNFDLVSFVTELHHALSSALQVPIAKGLAITINEEHLEPVDAKFLSNSQLSPAYKKLNLSHRGKAVTVSLYCGLGKSEDRASAGWHVFCNGRLILAGDKSGMTGWGEDTNGISIPGFHGQFNHLRGRAEFDCDDAECLPWNTTKTGVNEDSPVYRNAKIEMVKLMRPVVNFLNKLKEEKERREPDDPGPLEKLVVGSAEKSVDAVDCRTTFKPPVIKSEPRKRLSQRISYDKPIKEIEAAKQALSATSLKEVGEKTFDYFFKNEIGR